MITKTVYIHRHQEQRRCECCGKTLHGRSDARALVNGIGLVRKSVKNDLLNKLRSAITDHFRK